METLSSLANQAFGCAVSSPANELRANRMTSLQDYDLPFGNLEETLIFFSPQFIEREAIAKANAGGRGKTPR